MGYDCAITRSFIRSRLPNAIMRTGLDYGKWRIFSGNIPTQGLLTENTYSRQNQPGSNSKNRFHDSINLQKQEVPGQKTGKKLHQGNIKLFPMPNDLLLIIAL
jgi:hypothetical protein